MAQVVRRLRELRLSAHSIVFLILVTGGLTGFCVNLRMQQGVRTGDHIRQLRQRLLIHSAQSGGFPETIDELGRMGPAPLPTMLVDGWDRPIAYTPRERYEGGATERPAYAECELRSAGPNGEPGDEDDVVWVGRADSGGPETMPGGDLPMGGPSR